MLGVCFQGCHVYHQLSNPTWCSMHITAASTINGWFLSVHTLIRKPTDPAAVSQRAAATDHNFSCLCNATSVRGAQRIAPVMNKIYENTSSFCCTSSKTKTHMPDMYRNERTVNIIDITHGFLYHVVWGRPPIARLGEWYASMYVIITTGPIITIAKRQ